MTAALSIRRCLIHDNRRLEIGELANQLAAEFGCGDLHINVQMQRGENWISIDMYQNSEEPERLLAILDFDSGSHLLVDSAKTVH